MPAEPSYVYHMSHSLSLEKRARTIENIQEGLRGVDYDVIVCSGLSGVVSSSVISWMTGKPLLIVRKEDEPRHSRREAEGYLPNDCKWIIVDDLIDSGKTMRHIISTVKRLSTNSTLVGAYLYEDNEFLDSQELTKKIRS